MVRMQKVKLVKVREFKYLKSTVQNKWKCVEER